MGIETYKSESITRPDNSRVLHLAITKAEYGVIDQADTTLLPEPGVYCIYNTASNRCYIGCSVNVYSRIQTHKRQILAGNHICRGMVEDYAKNPEAFRFFCIQHVSESDYEVYESFRVSLLLLETQYTKRVPLGMLYNSVVPAALSERMLMLEHKRQCPPIKITDIIARLQMSEDSIRSNGFASSDLLSIEKAIEFVQKRTFPSGRWPAEKAVLAKEYLAELNALMPTGGGVDSLLMQGGVMDYFEGVTAIQQRIDDSPKYKNHVRWAEMKAAYNERKKTAAMVVEKPSKWPLWATFVTTAGASIPNMYSVSEAINHGGLSAFAMTACFTITPFLIILSRVRGISSLIPVFGVMAYTAFCNAIAIFGALTSLNQGYILNPSVFLETVTNYANTDYMSTARLLSCIMSVIVATIEFAAIKSLAREPNRFKK